MNTGLSVHPGDTCPTCERRVPFKKKADSPQTAVSSYRIPVGDKETHDATLEAWAEHWGLLGKPHWRFWLLTYAAADALSAPPRDVLGD